MDKQQLTEAEAFALLDSQDWIPEEHKERLRQKIRAQQAPGLGFALVVIPPGPGRDGTTIFYPMKRQAH
jgi:hypothetical protein